MKKKLIAFLCVLTCALSLAACGGSKSLTDFEQQKASQCEQLSYYLLQIAMGYGDAETLEDMTSKYNKAEMEALFESICYNNFQYNLEAELGAFEGMLTTYVQATEDMGGIVSTGNSTIDVTGKEITVTYELYGNNADGSMSFTYSNDIFTKLISAEATADLTIKQNLSKASKSMGNAALNTVLGMGTVFVMLILISLIISLFTLFNGEKKPAKEKVEEVIAPSAGNEENLADDCELVAVIMAAIQAYEGAGSTDGFVVRSIKRANRRN